MALPTLPACGLTFVLLKQNKIQTSFESKTPAFAGVFFRFQSVIHCLLQAKKSGLAVWPNRL